MAAHSEAAVSAEADVVTAARVRQVKLFAGVALAVVALDQATKWWAWRHVDGTLINSGGYILLGHAIRSWFAHPVSGALSDVAGATALISAVVWLQRRRRRAYVVIGTGLVTAGWASNILDRIGLHNWTAPGSARGVVDFVPGGPGRCNVADLFIAAGVILLGYAVGRRRLGDLPEDRPQRLCSTGRRRTKRLVLVLTLLAILTLALLSAIDHSGVYAPAAPASVSTIGI